MTRACAAHPFATKDKMNQTIETKNKALVLEAFDTL